jgi:hypothetical protein
MTTIGTCSICGGPVQVPTHWAATIPPVPTCAHCGATKQDAHGPVIKMRPARQTVTTIANLRHDVESASH